MLATCALAAVLLAQHRTPGPAQEIAQIRALYPKIDRIFENTDWRAASRMIAANYVEDSADHRKIDKATFLKEHIAATKGWYDVHSSVQPIDIKPLGRTATVEVRYLVTAKFKDQAGKHSLAFAGSEVHRWRKTGREWLLAYVKEHDYSLTVDGKVVQHAP